MGNWGVQPQSQNVIEVQIHKSPQTFPSRRTLDQSMDSALAVIGNRSRKQPIRVDVISAHYVVLHLLCLINPWQILNYSISYLTNR